MHDLLKKSHMFSKRTRDSKQMLLSFPCGEDKEYKKFLKMEFEYSLVIFRTCDLTLVLKLSDPTAPH